MQASATKHSAALDQNGAPPNTKSISEMASRYGVTLRTLRFYEEIGLLSPSRIGSSRYYCAKDEVKLQIIRKGRKLGFSLGEIEALVRSAVQQGASTIREPSLRLDASQIAGRLAALEEDRRRVVLALDELYDAQRKFG